LIDNGSFDNGDAGAGENSAPWPLEVVGSAGGDLTNCGSAAARDTGADPALTGWRARLRLTT
jgi:hypothetical protein